MQVHYSSEAQDWGTPINLYQRLDAIHHFTLDVCADAYNYKHKNYFDKSKDGLLQDWQDNICFMNPPYGREIKHWIKKAYEESCQRAKVVALIPARTDTTYWHDYIFPHAKIEFLKGRIKFEKQGRAAQPAPFPSAIIVFETHFSFRSME